MLKFFLHCLCGLPVPPGKTTDLQFQQEIIRTVSHNADSVSLIPDNGSCFAGDLEPLEYIEAYADHAPLTEDWNLIMSRNPMIIHYAHAPAGAVQTI